MFLIALRIQGLESGEELTRNKTDVDDEYEWTTEDGKLPNDAKMEEPKRPLVYVAHRKRYSLLLFADSCTLYQTPDTF